MKYFVVFLLGVILGVVGLLVFSFGTIGGLVVSDLDAPSDRVNLDHILILDDKVILSIPNATLSSYEDSGSMLPFFDEGANGIRVVPASVDEVEVGDIVSYRIFDSLVVHRVVKKGVDEGGVYFLVRGDNNLVGDAKIRFEDIEYVTVAVVY